MPDVTLPTTVEELTIAREGDDRMAPREQLHKKVLTKGAWSTVVYMYKELKRLKKGDVWSDPKLALVRYRKLKGSYKFQKEFSISNLDHAREMVEVLTEWLADGGAEPDAAAEGDAKTEGDAKADD